MSYEKWIKKNTASLAGKTVAVSGATGGIGRELCRHLLSLGASLLLLDRNACRSHALADDLRLLYPHAAIAHITVDLSDFASVKRATSELQTKQLYALILNAGAYSIPRMTCDTGYDNVFQINFLSPYYMVRRLMPQLRENGTRIVAVGSIAHRYERTDPADVDFSGRRAASKVYGNAKRHLMFALYELFRNETEARLAIVHPGITFTNITNHYPRPIFLLIKHPMKLIFMKPKKAALSILRGLFIETAYREWIGPRFFDVWGLPKKKPLLSVSESESRYIGETAERIYTELLEK